MCCLHGDRRRGLGGGREHGNHQQAGEHAAYQCEWRIDFISISALRIARESSTARFLTRRVIGDVLDAPTHPHQCKYRLRGEFR